MAAEKNDTLPFSFRLKKLQRQRPPGATDLTPGGSESWSPRPPEDPKTANSKRNLFSNLFCPAVRVVGARRLRLRRKRAFGACVCAKFCDFLNPLSVAPPAEKTHQK